MDPGRIFLGGLADRCDVVDMCGQFGRSARLVEYVIKP